MATRPRTPSFHRRAALIAMCVGLASCGPPRGSTLGFTSLRTTWQTAFFVHNREVAVRATNPGGLALVVWPPRVEQGDVVFNAGVASAGGGDVRYCFRIDTTHLADDWHLRLFWREPDGTRVPITEFTQGPDARFEISRCAVIEPSR